MARKGENIYKRKDGRWEGRYINSYDADGKAKYGYIYAKSYSGVREKLIQAKTESNCIIRSASQSIDFNKYDFWLKEWLYRKKISVKESTYIRYRNIVNNHISPEIGRYPINKISTALMEQFVHHKLTSGKLDNSGGISPKMANDILVIIKESFRYAQSCNVPVICNFSDISIKKSFREMRVLSNYEEKKLTSVLLKDIDRYKLGIYMCLYTGIRIGELCALQWKNISFTDSTLKVIHTMQRIQYENEYSTHKTHIIITEPKSSSAIRTIPLPEFLTEKLRPFVANPNAFVLSGECTQHVEPRTMQNKFKAYLAEGGIEDANFHSLRHTFATRCVEIGFDIKTLSEILGHSSVKITLDKYVHSSLELKRSNMEKLQPIVGCI